MHPIGIGPGRPIFAVSDARDDLLNAALVGDLRKVANILSLRPDLVNTTNRIGQTPLHLAVERKRDEVVQYLLAIDGCNINAQDADGYTPLHEATRNRDAYLVQVLFGMSARGDIVNSDGLTPLDLAVFLRLPQIIATLDPNLQAPDLSTL